MLGYIAIISTKLFAHAGISVYCSCSANRIVQRYNCHNLIFTKVNTRVYECQHCCKRKDKQQWEMKREYAYSIGIVLVRVVNREVEALFLCY